MVEPGKERVNFWSLEPFTENVIVVSGEESDWVDAGVRSVSLRAAELDAATSPGAAAADGGSVVSMLVSADAAEASLVSSSVSGIFSEMQETLQGDVLFEGRRSGRGRSCK